MKYEVPVVYRGQCNFVIEANSAEEAKKMVEIQFREGLSPTELGNEWEEIERIGEIKVIE